MRWWIGTTAAGATAVVCEDGREGSITLLATDLHPILFDWRLMPIIPGVQENFRMDVSRADDPLYLARYARRMWLYARVQCGLTLGFIPVELQ